MEQASNFTYISKRKLNIVKKVKESKWKEEEEEEDEGYSSLVEGLSDEELDLIGEADQAMLNANRVKGVSKKHKQEIDANVVAVKLYEISEEKELATGDLVLCANCSACLNNFSKLLPEEGENKWLWECEFCCYGNHINIEEEEKPKTESVTYVLSKPPLVAESPGEETKVEEEEKKDHSDETSVIFCIDISGSMDQGQSVGKKLKYMKSANYATRLECVKLAIDSQIESMVAESPERRVGFVLFEDSVHILGDCSGGKPHIISGQTMNEYGQLLEHAHSLGDAITQPVKNSQKALKAALEEMHTIGCTALGPGLVAATGLAAKGKPGSRVIICTDGLANVGMGSVSGSASVEALAFYEQVGNYAQERGIAIDVVSLVASECRLDMLSPIANLTGGNIIRVDPSKLSDDFAELLSERVLARNAVLRVQLHKVLEFRGEDEKNVISGGSVMEKKIGNITSESETTFEYMLKRPEELKLIEDVDIENLERIPFQTQIRYTTMKDMECVRIISMVSEITQEKEEANKEVDAEILKANAVHQTGKMAKKGDIRGAQANMMAWRGMVPEENLMEDAAPLYQAMKEQKMVLGGGNVVKGGPVLDNLTSAMSKADKKMKKK